MGSAAIRQRSPKKDKGCVTVMYTLEMKNIYKSFGGVNALSDVSLSVEKGEVHALIGENGAGKSTLMKVLAGAIKKDSGEIVIDGKKQEYSTPKEALSAGVSVIYQELNLVPDLTVAENIFLDSIPAKGGFVSWKSMNEESRRLLEGLGTDISPKDRIADLPVARQQMVEIAKAIKNNSRIVVFDEPSAVLGVKDSEILFSEIEKLKQQGISVIYISHRLDEIMRITDRITVLRDGKYITTQNTKDMTLEKVVEAMTGKEYSSIQDYVEYMKNDNEVVLEVQDICTKDLVKDISFQIKKGEVLGLAGLVGSGRTEIARAIFGADPKTKGKILMHGREIKIKSPEDAKKHGIGFVLEDRKTQGLHIKRPIFENICITGLKKYKKAGLLRNKGEYAAADEFKEKLAIKMGDRRDPVDSLSGGNQQKVSIAKWLHIQPDVLILDEPTRGVDIGAKSEIYKLIENIRREGTAILLISSEFAEILNLSDRVIVIKRGEMAGEFTREQIQKDSSILEAL